MRFQQAPCQEWADRDSGGSWRRADWYRSPNTDHRERSSEDCTSAAISLPDRDHGRPGADGALRLIVPGDHLGGRYVSNLVSLQVVDLMGAAHTS
jgi:hypothetical protein